MKLLSQMCVGPSRADDPAGAHMLPSLCAFVDCSHVCCSIIPQLYGKPLLQGPFFILLYPSNLLVLYWTHSLCFKKMCLLA